MLIFPSAITRILHRFSVSYPASPYFLVIGAKDRATVRWSEAQLQPRRPWTETITPPASTASSTSASTSWPWPRMESFCDKGSVYEGCSEDFCIFSFLSILDTLSLVHRSCDHLVIAHLVLMLIYIYWGCYYFLSPIFTYVVSFLSLCRCFLYNVCNLIFLFHTKMP